MTCRCHAYDLDGPLTCGEKEAIVTSLNYSIQAFEAYQDYPSREFQQQQIEFAKTLRSKVRALHKTNERASA